MSKANSPLRYPGGKAKVLNFMKELISNNSFEEKPAYIEPYAGGAGIALGLLFDGYVSKIFINDLDPAINSFWKSIKDSSERFIKKIQSTEVTIEEWHKQKAIYKKKKSGFDLAFATFFLNRCNRSGIITAGCIGGLKQNGTYKIDCRFNKNNLIDRIKKIAQFKDRIEVYSEDAIELLKKEEIEKEYKNCLLYLDPPYYDKGYQLYRNHYNPADHCKIADLIKKIKGCWVVSYDNVDEINRIYKGFEKRTFGLHYSAGISKQGKEIMFFSKAISNIPQNVIAKK